MTIWRVLAPPLAVSLLVSPLATPAGAQWIGNGTPLCTATNDQTTPVIVHDGSGGAFVVWQDARNGGANYDIYAQHVTAGGNIPLGWSPNGDSLCTAPGNQQQPAAVSDGAGGVIVAWRDNRSAFNADIYAQRVNSAGASLWATGGVAVCTAPNTQLFPVVVPDAAGGAIIVWQDRRNGFDYDLYAQRISATGTPMWTADGVPLCTAAADQVFPMAAADDFGGVLVAWQDSRNGAEDIYAQRLNGAGARPAGWKPNGDSVCVAANTQQTPSVTSDGFGGGLVAWYDLRSGINNDIYAQHVISNGTWSWAANGVLLCGASDDQFGPVLASDGEGGAFLAWSDFRNDPLNSDVYAQRVSPGGGIPSGWAPNGDSVSVATRYQTAPQVISDGSTGVIVAWQDSRNGVDNDVYAQLMNSSGVPQWTANGLAISTAGGSQTRPVLASDDAGGAIIAWQDLRGGVAYDIYAQRVTAGGGVSPTLDVPDAGAARVLLSARPNPSRSGRPVSFVLSPGGPARLEVCDLAGRRVWEWSGGGSSVTGERTVVWEGRDRSGSAAAPGVYLVRLRAGERVEVRRLVLLR